MKLHKYSKATKPELDYIRTVLDNSCSNLQPSHVLMWFDQNHSTEYMIRHNVLVARVYTNDGYVWTISSKAPIKYEQFKNISSEIFQIDPCAQELNYVPGDVISDLISTNKIKIEPEDVSSFDYVYDVEQQTKCFGSRFQDTRRHIKKFESTYKNKVKLELYDSQFDKNISPNEVEKLFDDWLHFGTSGSKESKNEQQALSVFFNKSYKKYYGKLLVLLMRHNEKLVGFSASELLAPNMALNHFQKANLNLSSISHYMFHTLSVTLYDNGIEFLNFQDDCDIGGLRAFKKKMRPIYQKKLYKVYLSTPTK